MSDMTEPTAEMLVSERPGVYYDGMCGEFVEFVAKEGDVVEMDAIDGGEIHRVSPAEFLADNDGFLEVSETVVADPVSFFEEIVTQLASQGEYHLGMQDIDFMYANRATSVREK